MEAEVWTHCYQLPFFITYFTCYFRQNKAKVAASFGRGQQLGLWSAYRSDKRQKELWDDRVKELLKDPKWAAIALVDKKAFEREVARGVARPGTGPHRTGRAVDLYISSKYLNKLDNAARFRQEEAFQWLNENASKYGFYNYYEEPWHWEYNPKSL